MGEGGGGRKEERREVQSFHKHTKNQEFLVYIHKINTYIYLYVFIYIHLDVERE